MSHISLSIKHLFIQFLHLSTCILGTRPCLNLSSVKASKRPLLISNITTSFPIADTATNATTHESVELSTSQILGRDSFPPGFIFGAGSSAYQTEGAWNKGGRGPSIWDTFCHDHPEKIADGSNADVAVESYYRYKEDVKLLKDMNMDAFRFSISWSRILPNGSLKGGINQEGINYYNNLIDELLSNGITPYVTLFHWDLPQGLQDHGGFANRQTVSDFIDYSNLCFQKFGDKVKYWITVNEPYHYSTNGHAHGDVAPGRCTPIFGCSEGNSIYEPYIVSHNLILAHGEAVRLYREKYQASQGGQIGIVLDCFWYEPYNDMHQHRDAANRLLDFNFGWYMDPLVYGDYPFIMKAIVRDRLPTFTQEESKMITKSFDFIGLNYYTARYAKSKAFSPENYPLKATDDTYAEELVSNGHSDIGIWSNGAWIEVYPKGIKQILLRIKDIYGNPPVYVSENGYADLVTTGLTKEEEIADKVRMKYFELHLPEVKDVIKAGADVKGYFVWSLTDNFEWLSGYTLRFGLHYVDYDTMERTPKDSAKWFSRLLKK